MYSRYAGYQPFIPMNNRLSPQVQVEEEIPVPEQTAIPNADTPLEAAGAPAAGFLEQLLGGRRGKGRRGGGGSSLFGNLGSLGGIADLLRSGGGGVGKFLQGLSINWDSGDILLALILLFMSLESDDDEILILLGLMLVQGF